MYKFTRHIYVSTCVSYQCVQNYNEECFIGGSNTLMYITALLGGCYSADGCEGGQYNARRQVWSLDLIRC
jgi:hypothetical protein